MPVSSPASLTRLLKGDTLKHYVYRNVEFMGYRITRSGSVYLPNKKGTLSRIKGAEANLVLQKYIAAVRTAEEKAKETQP
jgi:hypothetical protein